MNLNLENREWKEFVFENFFEIDSTSSGIDRNRLINDVGSIPYLTRSEKNNAYDSFICAQSDKYKTDDSNVITVGLDTQTVFYQPSKFYTGQNIQILKSNDLNKEIALFLIPLIKRQMEKFNWGGNGATLTRLKRSKLLVPVNSKGEPDYNFMQQYAQNKEQQKQKGYQEFIQNRFNKLKNTPQTVSLEEKQWGEFELGKMFKLVPGKSKGLNHLNKTKLGINYLGATNSNNGVLANVDSQGNEKMIQKGNCIAFIRNGEGSMGYSIYKSEEFIATSDISVGYSKNLNREIGMFITTIADKIRGKYNFGYKRSATRLKKEKLQLPIDKNGEPDYMFMENYMKNIEFKKLSEYLEFKNN